MMPAARHWNRRTLLPAISIAAVLIAIGAGLFVIGSPADVRARRLDAQRIDHLREWARAIDAYWTANNQLPQTLDEIRRQQAWTHLAVTDPETGEPYRYQSKGAVGYELCATFERESADMGAPDEDALWGHAAGPACFPLEARTAR
ncbi:MAG: hypothetical protein M3Q55_07595 [Acidobacteriota bacterium]|nr:hypothetical protein [Acidobacteriota bacterium]